MNVDYENLVIKGTVKGGYRLKANHFRSRSRPMKVISDIPPPYIVQLCPNRGRGMEGGGFSMFCVGKNGNFDIIGFFKFYFKILVCHVHKTIFKS